MFPTFLPTGARAARHPASLGSTSTQRTAIASAVMNIALVVCATLIFALPALLRLCMSFSALVPLRAQESGAWTVAVAVVHAAFSMLCLCLNLLFAPSISIVSPDYSVHSNLKSQPRVKFQYISPFGQEEEKVKNWDAEVATGEEIRILLDDSVILINPSVEAVEAPFQVKPNINICSPVTSNAFVKSSVDVLLEAQHNQVSPASLPAAPVRKSLHESQVGEVIGESREDEDILTLDFAARVQKNKKPISRYRQDTLASARKRRSKFEPSSPPTTPGLSSTRTSRPANAKLTPVRPASSPSAPAAPAAPARAPLASRTNYVPLTPAKVPQPDKNVVQSHVAKSSAIVNKQSSSACPAPESVVVGAPPAPLAPRAHDMAIIAKRLANIPAQKIFRVIHADSDEGLVNAKSILVANMISWIESVRANSPRTVIDMLEKAPKRARYDLYDELMNIDDSDKNNLVAEEKSKESKGRKCEVSAPSLRLMVAMNQSHVAAGCYSGVKPGSGTSSRLRKNFRL